MRGAGSAPHPGRCAARGPHRPYRADHLLRLRRSGASPALRHRRHRRMERGATSGGARCRPGLPGGHQCHRPTSCTVHSRLGLVAEGCRPQLSVHTKRVEAARRVPNAWCRSARSNADPAQHSHRWLGRRGQRLVAATNQVNGSGAHCESLLARRQLPRRTGNPALRRSAARYEGAEAKPARHRPTTTVRSHITSGPRTDRHNVSSDLRFPTCQKPVRATIRSAFTAWTKAS